MTFKNIQLIINPAAGQDEPILNTLNSVFQDYDVRWQVAVTQESGDAERLTKAAVANGADLVAGYGGDGTLMEVVNGLHGSDVPLGVLPGGTANGLARDMMVPLELEKAARLFCEGGRVREIDLGICNDKYFMLHAYIGLQPDHQASREDKDKFGMLGYLGTIVNVIKNTPPVDFFLTIDEEEIEFNGVICAVVNLIGLGIELPVKEKIDPSDGLLDVFLINKDLAGAVESLRKQELSGDIFQHYRGRKVHVRSEPAEEIWLDGEDAGETPFYAEAAPKALRVVVPVEEEKM